MEMEFQEVPHIQSYFVPGHGIERQYFKYFCEKLNVGEFVDVEGEAAYVLEYLPKLAKPFVDGEKELKWLLNRLDEIENHYGDLQLSSATTIHDEIERFRGCSFLYAGDFKTGWGYRRDLNIGIEELVGLKRECQETINAKDLHFYFEGVDSFGSVKGLTRFGKENSGAVLDICESYLEGFRRQHEKGLIESFLDSFSVPWPSIQDLAKLKSHFPDPRVAEELWKVHEAWEEAHRNSEDSDVNQVKDFPLYDFPASGCVSEIQVPYIPAVVEGALTYEVNRILRECENSLREERDIPHIGEGWVSETELYYKIDNVFADEEVLHHGRPNWLGRQHLDIFFPEKNVAIEYQGKQHSEPVDYFGGEEAFREQQKRDKRKQRLCAENNCELFYAHEGYDFEALCAKIEEALE